MQQSINDNSPSFSKSEPILQPAPTRGSSSFDYNLSNPESHDGSLHVNPPMPSGTAPSDGEQADVVIIGAGVSGLSCAYHLRQLDPKLKVIVLEARPRLGGRVWTVPVNPSEDANNSQNSGRVIDLGGSWIHGTNNPLYRNHHEFGLKLKNYKVAKQQRQTQSQSQIQPQPASSSAASSNPETEWESYIQDGVIYFDAHGKPMIARDVAEIRRRFDKIFYEMKDYGSELREKYYKEKPDKENSSFNRRIKSCCQSSRWWEDESVKTYYDRNLESYIREWVKELCPENFVEKGVSHSKMVNKRPNHHHNGSNFHHRRGFNLSESQIRDIVSLRRLQTEFYYNGKEKRLSVAWLDDDGETEPTGGDHLVMNGYDKLVQYLARDMDIRRAHVVERIVTLDEPVGTQGDLAYQVQARYTSADPEEKKRGESTRNFLCRHVVVTVPLGVLKKTHTELFQPPLPLWKQESIGALGFGVLDKVVLRFDTCFWGHASWIGIAPPAASDNLVGKVQSNVQPNSKPTTGPQTNANVSTQSNTSHPHPPPRNANQRQANSWAAALTKEHFCYFKNYHDHLAEPVLCAFVGPSVAQSMERMTDEQVVIQRALDDLSRCYGKELIERHFVKGHLITKWQNDPFARGSYSYIALGATGDDYDAMSLNVGNILFAGEATFRKAPATVHGAYRSGIREAKRLFDMRAAAKSASALNNNNSSSSSSGSTGSPSKDDRYAHSSSFKKKKFEYKCKCKL